MATISKAKQQNFINGESFDAVDGATIQNEIFGPVITVQQFDDEAKAIEWANATRYGLAASVSTRDIGRAHRVANAIRFGTVRINDHITMATEMPHGGFKQSGHGKASRSTRSRTTRSSSM